MVKLPPNTDDTVFNATEQSARDSSDKQIQLAHLSASRTSLSINKIYSDDLIAALANRLENQRARQVVEWEKTRRRINAFKAA